MTDKSSWSVSPPGSRRVLRPGRSAAGGHAAGHPAAPRAQAAAAATNVAYVFGGVGGDRRAASSG